ncbi:MAG: DUF1232 domain-containing protein [Chloroflexi bacterium]|nr:DUF1232 domain-containing protein [Chloroflexota bacterium]
MNENQQPVAPKPPSALTELIRNVRLAWRLLNDSRVPVLPKLIIPAAALYVLSPLDILPDFILGLGQLDDLGIVLLGLAFFVGLCPRGVVEEHRAAIERGEHTTAATSKDAIDGTYRVIPDDEAK